MFTRNAQQSVDVDLIAAIKLLWNRKLPILLITFTVVGLAGLLSFSMEDIYRSEAKLMPVKQDSELGALQGMASQLGGLASLAGFNMPSSNDESGLALEILTSRQFILDFVKKYKLQPYLLAGIGWQRDTDRVVYDPAIYDQQTGSWLIEADNGATREPTDTELVEAFEDLYSINQSLESGLVSLNVEYFSPRLASEWAGLIIVEINQFMKKRALQESQSKIQYLTSKVEDTDLRSVHTIFSQLIENEVQKKMLAETKEDYVLNVIDPPFVPDRKVRPLRALILLVAFFAGAIFSCIAVLVHAAFYRNAS